MEQAGASRYWCHVCSREVNPIMEMESMKCPVCESGFLEETAPANETHSPSDRALPILLGMMARPQDAEEHAPNPDDQELEALIARRRRSAAAVLQLLQGLRAGMVSESDDQEPEQQRMILINPFSHSIIMQQGAGFIAPGLELLMLAHLIGNDPNRYGTPPAQKEAVEALQTLKIETEMKCSICLDECDVGAELKEMPCKHKFHSTCILTWLDLHSSCPICRYQLPADESKLVSDSSRGDGEDVRRFSLPLPLPLPLLWPLDSLLSPSSEMNSSSLVSSRDADDN